MKKAKQYFGSAQSLFMFSYEYNTFKPTKLQDSVL